MEDIFAQIQVDVSSHFTTQLECVLPMAVASHWYVGPDEAGRGFHASLGSLWHVFREATASETPETLSYVAVMSVI